MGARDKVAKESRNEGRQTKCVLRRKDVPQTPVFFDMVHYGGIVMMRTLMQSIATKGLTGTRRESRLPISAPLRQMGGASAVLMPIVARKEPRPPNFRIPNPKSEIVTFATGVLQN